MAGSLPHWVGCRSERTGKLTAWSVWPCEAQRYQINGKNFRFMIVWSGLLRPLYICYYSSTQQAFLVTYNHMQPDMKYDLRILLKTALWTALLNYLVFYVSMKLTNLFSSRRFIWQAVIIALVSVYEWIDHLFQRKYLR